MTDLERELEEALERGVIDQHLIDLQDARNRERMDDSRRLALDRRVYGISFETKDGKRVDPESVESSDAPVRVEFDPEQFYSEKKRIKQMMRDDPLNF
jgi:hypothetical protein